MKLLMTYLKLLGTYGWHFLVFLFLMSACNMVTEKQDKIRDLPVENTYNDNLKLKNLSASISASPKDPDLYFKRSELLLSLNQTDAAIDDALKAQQLDTTNGKYSLAVAKAYRKLPNIMKALEAGYAAERKGLQTPDLYVTIGEMLFIVKSYDKSTEYLNKALKVAQYYAEAYFYKGLLYAETKDSARAISNLQTCIEQDAHYVDAYNKLASLYFDQKKFDTGKAYLTSGLRYAPKDGFLNYNMGMYYVYTNQKDSAIAYLRKAIFFEPQLSLAHYNLGYFAYQDGDYVSAANALENATNYNDQDEIAFYFLGVSRENNGNVDGAIRAYQRVMILNRQKLKEAREGISRLSKVQGIGAKVDTNKSK